MVLFRLDVLLAVLWLADCKELLVVVETACGEVVTGALNGSVVATGAGGVTVCNGSSALN